MTSGWTRWILEQFEFPFSRVFAPGLDAGNLNAKSSALIFVDGAIPSLPGAGAEPGWPLRLHRGGGGALVERRKLRQDVPADSARTSGG